LPGRAFGVAPAGDVGDAANMVRTDSHQLRAVAGDSPGAGAVKVVAQAHKTLAQGSCTSTHQSLPYR